jgi:uncharacterized SAM-binding protein YcdF (DUF218 family)
MAEIVKHLLVPGSIPFLVASLVAGVVLLYLGERARWWGRTWLTGILLLYAFLAMPLGADFVAAPLVHPFVPVTSREQVRDIDTVVVLSAGGEVYQAYGTEVAEMGKATAANALEAARLNRLFSPATFIASGGIVEPGTRREPEAAVLAAGMARLGIPRGRILLETSSRTTREQAVNVAAMLGPRRTNRFLLVTTADHMPRAAATFRERGLQPVPSVSTFAMGNAPTIWHRLQPSLGALRQSDWACYEYLARVYYWYQGWL